MDYRAAGGAAAYLGLGAIWALGLSSSAALLQANAGSLPKSLLPITGVIPFTETIFLWQSMAVAAILIAVAIAIAYFSAPGARNAPITAEAMGIDVCCERRRAKSRRRAAGRMARTFADPDRADRSARRSAGSATNSRAKAR